MEEKKIVFAGGKPLEISTEGKPILPKDASLQERVIAPVPPDGFILLPEEEYRDALEGFPAGGIIYWLSSQIFFIFYLFYFTLRYISAKILGIYTRHQLIFTTKRLVMRREYYFLKKVIRIKNKNIPLSYINEVTLTIGRNGWLIVFSVLCLINSVIWMLLVVGPGSSVDDIIIFGLNLLFIGLFYFTYLISVRSHLVIRYRGGRVAMFHWGESEFLSLFSDRLLWILSAIYSGKTREDLLQNISSIKECPHCAKVIPENAIKCRYCKNYI